MNTKYFNIKNLAMTLLVSIFVTSCASDVTEFSEVQTNDEDLLEMYYSTVTR